VLQQRNHFISNTYASSLAVIILFHLLYTLKHKVDDTIKEPESASRIGVVIRQEFIFIKSATDDDNDDDINLRPRDLPKGIRTC